MQCVSYLLAVDLYGLAVVVEHGRHVLIRYPICGFYISAVW